MPDHVKERINTFDIGIMRPEDVRGVVELFRTVYGDGYPIKKMYDPAHLLGRQERGEMDHIVAALSRLRGRPKRTRLGNFR
jgi:hypothetical protein